MRIRGLILLVMVVLAVAFAASAGARSVRVQRQEAVAVRLLQQINAVRTRHGLAAVQASAPLTLAAANHTREMGTRGYFAHDSADGSTFDRRVAHWYTPAGRTLWSVGENLLWTAPVIGAPTMIARWLASPEHRAILLDPTWREVGIYVARIAPAPGFYGDRSVTIVTADFGVRH